MMQKQEVTMEMYDIDDIIFLVIHMAFVFKKKIPSLYGTDCALSLWKDKRNAICEKARAKSNNLCSMALRIKR